MTASARLAGGPSLPDPTDIDALRVRLAADGEADPRRRPIGLDRVQIGPDALDHLVAVVRDLRAAGPVVVIVDTTAMRRSGEDLKARVVADLSAHFDTRVAVIEADGAELHADGAALAQADRAIAGAGCVVAVGSGTITDIAKDASMRAGDIPFVVVQTAVSVNAFSDDMAVLLRDGVKRTVPSRWPDALIVDLAVIADAPAAMNRAGFGELCSMFTAPADWYLATAIGMDDGYDRGVVDLFRDGAEALLAGADRVRVSDPEQLDELARRMTLTGIAMGVAGRTAPLSGTEHLLSHLLDMAAGAANRPLAFHGAQVGLACVLAATIWHDTLDHLDPTTLASDAAFPPADAVERRVHAAFDPIDPSGRMADECWRDVRAKVARWSEQRDRVAAFAADWDRHRAALRELVASPDVLRDALQRAGAPAEIADLEPPAAPDVTRWALRALPFMRDRFTVADLRFFGGAWSDPEVDALLERSGILGRAGAVR
ncbi:MAG: iron-containing alcohol dehydrogenase [Candidatus Limnocylindrales bacterium]